MARFFSYLVMLIVLSGIVFTGCKKSESGPKKLKFAFVTNVVDPFWNVAEAGCKKAAEELGVDVDVIMPPGGVPDQKRMVEDVLIRGVDGIAISPLDPTNQREFLNEVASKTNMITHDSDAPFSNRLVYIGVDNYEAGRITGKLVKEALPDGGKIMIFIGNLDQDNSKFRRQGVIDELLDRPEDRKKKDYTALADSEKDKFFDPTDVPIGNDKYTILGTRTDNGDLGRAKEVAQDTIIAHPDIKGMVGLFAYNPPKILAAVKEADKLSQIKIIGMDENEVTLQGIVDGQIHGTCVQNPYMYGYKSVEVLTKLAKGDKSVIPEDKFINFPVRPIKKDNVKEFWTELNKNLGKPDPFAGK